MNKGPYTTFHSKDMENLKNMVDDLKKVFRKILGMKMGIFFLENAIQKS